MPSGYSWDGYEQAEPPCELRDDLELLAAVEELAKMHRESNPENIQRTREPENTRPCTHVPLDSNPLRDTSNLPRASRGRYRRGKKPKKPKKPTPVQKEAMLTALYDEYMNKCTPDEELDDKQREKRRRVEGNFEKKEQAFRLWHVLQSTADPQHEVVFVCEVAKRKIRKRENDPKYRLHYKAVQVQTGKLPLSTDQRALIAEFLDPEVAANSVPSAYAQRLFLVKGRTSGGCDRRRLVVLFYHNNVVVHGECDNPECNGFMAARVGSGTVPLCYHIAVATAWGKPEIGEECTAECKVPPHWATQ